MAGVQPVWKAIPANAFWTPTSANRPAPDCVMAKFSATGWPAASFTNDCGDEAGCHGVTKCRPSPSSPGRVRTDWRKIVRITFAVRGEYIQLDQLLKAT